MRKVHWPTRTEVRNLTLVVLAVTFLMAAFLGSFSNFLSIGAWCSGF